MKRCFLFLGVCMLAAVSSFAQGYPQWLQQVQAAELEYASYVNSTTNWYALRVLKEETYEKLCYEKMMDDSSPFVQKVQEMLGKDLAKSQLTSLYALMKGRREWLQMEASNGKIFSLYVIVAANPLDLSYMTEESFQRLRALFRLDFDEKINFPSKVERIGDAVFVSYENWNDEDALIRIGFNLKSRVIDICRNECSENPF